MVQSKYTKDEPFEFEGVKVWRDREMVRYTDREMVRYTAYQEYVNAFHAFIEAERNEWHWTNDDHTEARKGRWVAVINDSMPSLPKWGLKHDDFPKTRWWSRPKVGASDVLAIKEVFDEFDAWKSAQDQPAEPAASKFGYVGTKDDKDVFRSENGTYGLVSRETGNWIEGLTWSEVCKFDGEFKGVPRD